MGAWDLKIQVVFNCLTFFLLHALLITSSWRNTLLIHSTGTLGDSSILNIPNDFCLQHSLSTMENYYKYLSRKKTLKHYFCIEISFKRQYWRMQSRHLCLSDLLEIVCTSCQQFILCLVMFCSSFLML